MDAEILVPSAETPELSKVLFLSCRLERGLARIQLYLHPARKSVKYFPAFCQ